MSRDVKFFARPKVRFSQADANKLEENELKNKTEQENTVPSNKPRITSIVTLDKPIKLIKINAEFNDKENKDLHSNNNAEKLEASTVCSNAFTSCTDEITPPINNSEKTEIQKPLSNVNNIENVKGNSKTTDTSKISKKSISDSAIIPSTSSAMQNGTSNKVLKSQNTAKINGSKRYVKAKEGKENEALTSKKCVKDIIKVTSNVKLSHHKTKSLTTINAKKANVICKSSTPASSKRINSKSIMDVMPCNKYNKTTLKVKQPLIKKTIIRDVIGPKIKPYVGPGTSHKKEDSKVSEMDENICIRQCTSGDKLARPEYNSIMCTINKLNEMKKQKVVTDIEQLPATYKNIITGKISNALDFPLDEAIYKNLVDLSIDEKQLPSRLTRSKDPEPRQRDAVPELSDFFTPVSPEEYCTPVSVKPRIQEIADNWSAFKINDKILEWKHSLDHL